MRPVLFLAATVLAAGCGPAASTVGERIEFAAALAGGTRAGASPTGFGTEAGWQVTLEEARVALGPVYLYDGEPMARRSRWPRLVSSAHACGAHAQYSYGETLAEVLDQRAVDLLDDEPLSVGSLEGIAGTVRSAEVHLHPPGEVEGGASDADLDLLEGETLRLRGWAADGSAEIPFLAAMTVPDEGTMRIVESVAVDGVQLRDSAEQPGELVVEVLLDRWLASVDFGSLEQEQDGVYVFDEDSQAWTALLLGVRSREAYRVTWREP